MKEEIKKFREMLGINQIELSRRTGITPATISRYESGQREPYGKSLIKLAKALKVTPNDILGWKDEHSRKK